MKKIYTLVCFVLLCCATNILGQVTLPPESQFATVTQNVGDAKITITYHRPNTKGRELWGKLVPYNEPWRAGANDNTTIEFTTDVNINGQKLAAGKYGFHTIPTETEWTIIFNNVNNAWGSFTYKPDQDALRVKVKPTAAHTSYETLLYTFEDVTANSTKVILSWGQLQIPFTVDVGDVNARLLNQLREAIKNRQADDVRALNQAAGFVYTYKLKDNYNEAIGWIDESIKVKETFANLNTKARLLAETGKKSEAISTAEKAINIGKTSTPPANPNIVKGLETELEKWKAN